MKKLLVVLVIPLLLLLATEGVLALFQVASLPTLFVTKVIDGQTYLCANPGHSFWGEPFIEVCLTPKKKPGVYRVFVVGESTANGYPYTRSCSPASWLQVRLEQLHPGRQFEVLRLSASGKQATQLAEFCAEVVAYDPDLIVLYSGHNEFFIEYIPQIKHPYQAAIRDCLFQLRLVRVLAGLLSIEPAPPLDPLADKRQIADVPYLSAAEFGYGERRYRRALRAIAATCQSHGVRLIACLPACNLREYPPTYSCFGAATSPAHRQRVRQLFAQGEQALASNDAAAARAALEPALALDPAPAIVHYLLGRALLDSDVERARDELERARDLDNYPIRMQRPLQDALRDEAHRGGFTLADCPRVFEAVAADHIPGLDLFVDHCHPELMAQNLIATAVLQAMARASLIVPCDQWQFASEPDANEYLKRLNLKLPEIANEFSANAVHSLLNRLQAGSRHEAAAAAQRVFCFALRYDPENGMARLGQSLAAYVEGRLEEARALARDGVARDPRLRHIVREFIVKHPELNELYAGVVDPAAK